MYHQVENDWGPGFPPVKCLLQRQDVQVDGAIVGQRYQVLHGDHIAELVMVPLPFLVDAYHVLRFHAQKSSAIFRCTEIIENELDGNVPDTMEGLIALPGVGEKTAACVLSYGFGKRSVIVDVHIARVASRIGLLDSPKPCDVKKALERIVPDDRWEDMDIAFITLGRELCRPSNPSCDGCPVKNYCNHCNPS